MEHDSIKCKYIFNDDYNPKYVNGAFGGLNPRGEIVINFFLERLALPNSQTFKVDKGNVGEELIDERKPDDHKSSIVRIVENGIILDYNNAKEIHRWLGEHISKHERLVK